MLFRYIIESINYNLNYAEFVQNHFGKKNNYYFKNFTRVKYDYKTSSETSNCYNLV